MTVNPEYKSLITDIMETSIYSKPKNTFTESGGYLWEFGLFGWMLVGRVVKGIDCDYVMWFS